MCGIFAYIVQGNIDKPTNIYNEKFIMRQFEKGKSRGPESSNTFITQYHESYIFMGFHRLAINGLEPETKIMCIDGIYLICNGEIYNYRSFKFKTNSKSDCEVIIHLYKLYGIKYLFELLDGVFAFVLYDTNIQRMFVARDPYGVRPLFIHNNSTFASELKQIVKIGINVKQFEPGTFMELKIEKNFQPTVIRQERYTTFGFSKMIFNNLYDIYGILYQSLYSAVKKRVTTTERPIACLLSGGLDSSTITALVNMLMPKDKKLETYSIGMEGSTDLVYAQILEMFV